MFMQLLNFHKLTAFMTINLLYKYTFPELLQKVIDI